MMPCRNAATDNIQSNIDDAVDKRFLTPEQATAEKKAAALRLTVANYTKLAQEDPARAIEELTAEESPHPLVRYLPPETRDSLVTRAQLNMEARRLDREMRFSPPRNDNASPHRSKANTSSSRPRMNPISPLASPTTRR
jgi:hypothetical protein